ncbi:MAG: fibrobacter succinogenes major paralogous domain-containing protein [Bacteroidales bacterium]|nr:fibrobacter succinogenes major paralogous domain-containing protein [Bacteroidales bacterium]
MKRYMKQLGTCLFVLFVGILFTRCEKDHLMIKPDPQKPLGDGICGTVTDYDGNVYDVVRLGNQEWMAQNLRTTHYANGTSIPQGSSTSTTTAYRYCPNNSSSNVYPYGYLYNWKAVMGNSSSSSSNPSHVQGICPNGWHVPSDVEWTELENYVATCSYYTATSGNVAKALASTEDWNTSGNSGAVGNDRSQNNSTGFSALPAGGYYGSISEFADDANFWSATANGSNAISRYLNYTGASVYCSFGSSKTDGYSVRCVRD